MDGLRKLRESRGMTQEQVNAATGISPSVLRFWERCIGRMHYRNAIKRLCDLFDCEPVELLMGPKGED